MGALAEYARKRNFEKTKEPSGKKRIKLIDLSKDKAKPTKNPKFVVQMHDASHLHHDFRLEISGVLVSWAVPKELPNPGEKRLAVMTEDHPLDYGSFEGIIPEGNYGAGTVMIWDYGNYENYNYGKGKLINMKESLKNGKIHVILNGKKLKGDYILVKFKGQEKNWLIMRPRAAKKEKRDDKSALTGRTLKQIEKEG